MKTMREVVVPGQEGMREAPGRLDLVAIVLGEELPAAAVLQRKAMVLGESSPRIWEA
jgi:hypothetical protein